MNWENAGIIIFHTRWNIRKNGKHQIIRLLNFLRYSLYKPRDILTMLNEMVDATSGTQFKHSDFEGIFIQLFDVFKRRIERLYVNLYG